MQSIPIEEYIALRRLLNSKQIGIVRLKALLNSYSNATKVLQLPSSELVNFEKITESALKGFIQGVSNSENDAEFKDDYDYIHSIGGYIVSYSSTTYPSSLKNIYDSPILLYIVGQLTEQDKKSLAIVGTRTPSPYGTRCAGDFSKDLAAEGFTVVSGLARGIDTTAHKSAIEAGGRTIAVLGSGFKNIYPSENKKLVKDIISQGCVVTEYSPNTKPDAINFPARNRIISGLALGTLVVEAAEKGGALHTAAFAIDQGKEVFAIPGNINSVKSGGTNKLIQMGNAKLVLDVNDILIEFNMDLRTQDTKTIVQPEILDLTVFEEKIYSSIAFEPLHIDEVSNITGLSTSDCLINLLQLEFRGLIRQLPGKNFVRF
jgi:DNA processing protein